LGFAYFSDKFSNFFLGLASNHNSPIYSSGVTEIIGVSHHAWLIG
jgi:hypothetical protein